METNFAAPDIAKLYEAAFAVRLRAYAPYSGYLVGAAVRTLSGAIYVGCNVENASYGATICAERIAIGAAVSSEGNPKITAILIITDAQTPWPPCGMCRQVIAEFDADCVVYCANLQGIMHSTPFAKLYPQSFTSGHLRAL